MCVSNGYLLRYQAFASLIAALFDWIGMEYTGKVHFHEEDITLNIESSSTIFTIILIKF